MTKLIKIYMLEQTMVKFQDHVHKKFQYIGKKTKLNQCLKCSIVIVKTT